MKSLITLTLTLLCLTGFAQDTDDKYTGTWSGALDVNGTKLEFVFHIGTEECTMDVPTQGIKGFKSEFSEISDDSVRIRIPMIWAAFTGRYEDDRMTGTYTQSGVELPLTLLRGDLEKAERPQTPVPPFPYNTEDVAFTNGSAVLSGTLATPAAMTPDTPVVLMITGSGAQNRDEELMEHRPFAVIADAFARNGIATLRYDDRGFAKSTGDLTNATTDTLAADAAAGIAFLRSKGYTNVGALGHSEGGTIVFMLAADSANSPDFIISMAGMIESGEATLLAQVKAQAVIAEMTEVQANIYAKQVVNQFRSSGNAWSTRFLELDPAPFVRATKCRVLAINGGKDMQVLADRNIPLLKELLPEAETKIYPGLNHLFQHCNTGLPAEYYGIEETISPEVLQDMIKWIL